MKAIIKFRNDRADKTIRFINSKKIVDMLCDTKFGKGIAYVLYNVCKIQCIIFD